MEQANFADFNLASKINQPKCEECWRDIAEQLSSFTWPSLCINYLLEYNKTRQGTMCAINYRKHGAKILLNE